MSLVLVVDFRVGQFAWLCVWFGSLGLSSVLCLIDSRFWGVLWFVCLAGFVGFAPCGFWVAGFGFKAGFGFSVAGLVAGFPCF